jgi:hypothetical protein
MDACTIKGDNGSVNFDYSNVRASSPNSATMCSLTALFSLASQGPYGIGFNVWNGSNGPEVGSHHVWLLNSIVRGFSQSGVQMNAAEYHYVITRKTPKVTASVSLRNIQFLAMRRPQTAQAKNSG